MFTITNEAERRAAIDLVADTLAKEAELAYESGKLPLCDNVRDALYLWAKEAPTAEDVWCAENAIIHEILDDDDAATLDGTIDFYKEYGLDYSAADAYNEAVLRYCDIQLKEYYQSVIDRDAKNLLSELSNASMLAIAIAPMLERVKNPMPLDAYPTESEIDALQKNLNELNNNLQHIKYELPSYLKAKHGLAELNASAY